MNCLPEQTAKMIPFWTSSLMTVIYSGSICIVPSFTSVPSTSVAISFIMGFSVPGLMCALFCKCFWIQQLYYNVGKHILQIPTVVKCAAIDYNFIWVILG